jgi:D-arabinonate dehydratase/D-galactarolactone cycloisomerase
MKITDVRTDFLRTGRTLLRIFTDEGLVGASELGWGHNRAAVAWVDEVVAPMLAGEDPRDPARHWDRLVFGISDARTRVPVDVVGSVDVALWDLAGKAAGVPLHRLLGGAARTTIPLYWSTGMGWRKTPDEMLGDVQRGFELGFRAFKIRMDWGPFRQDADPRKDFELFRRCREWLPPEVGLGFDANSGYSVSTAILQGRRFEALGISHFEEPIPYYDLPGLRQVVDALDVPISSGEFESTRFRFADLIALGNPDIVQPDIELAGGITELRRIADLATAHNKPVMPHSPYMGLNGAASLHVYATLQNGIQPHEFSTEGTASIDEIAELFVEPMVPRNGRIELSDRPGLGLELDERAVERAIVRQAEHRSG